jgi:nucleoside-diphosphate-sugar epimerase
VRIFVAGGAGYIGSYLAPILTAHGHDLHVSDLLWFGNHLPVDVQVVRRDLFECTSKDLEGFDQVLFLAGISNDPMAEFSPAKNFVFNAALPAYLALQAKRAGVRRFIYASTCSVYGNSLNQIYDEEAPTTATYPYGVSKLQGEQGVHHFQEDGFSVISLRQGTVSGYSPRMRLDLIVNTMFKSAMTERMITIDNPSIWRPVFSLSDVAIAYLRAVQADFSISGVFNVMSENCTVGHVGDLVKTEVERLTGDPIRVKIRNIDDLRNYKVSIEKARTELGFQPAASLKDIVEDLFVHRELFSDFGDDAYYNIRVFKKIEAQPTSANY